MRLRIATFNANNLFRRPKVFQLEGMSADAAKVLEDVQKLESLRSKPSYSGATGTAIIGLLKKYEFGNSKLFPEERWFQINEVRGKLFRVKRVGTVTNAKAEIELVAQGRSSWLGWIELTRENVNAVSTDNTARVIQAVNADVLCLVEVEDRHTLDRFDRLTLAKFKASFGQNLLIDGNDPRGIDIGVLSRFPIRSVRSHIDDVTEKKRVPIFSRDCPEFEIELPDGRTLWLLGNHFKSQGYGAQAANDAKRKLQAQRVREILRRFDLTRDLVVVAGDLNGTPTSAPLKPLLTTPGLCDVLKSPLHHGPSWTYHDGRQQIDYLLVSQPLFASLKSVGIERRGLFHKTNFGGKFPYFAEVTDEVTQASDHAAVWAEFEA
jgi:endonuclease/exonuclease/phosphatase family metal-dependent hydrolase